MKKSKEKVISEKMNQYLELFSSLEVEEMTIAEKLCKQAAFMDVTLEGLQEIINKEGPVTEGTNGNGFTVRSENPAQKSYNQMIRNYNTIIKTLMDLLPEGSGEDDLEQFIRGRK